MDQAALVRLEFERIAKGAELVTELRAGGLSVDAAFWLFTSEQGRWGLHLIVPDFEQRGIRETYKMIVNTIRALPRDYFSIEPDEVTVEDRSYPLAKAIGSLQAKYGDDFSKTGYGVRIDDQYLDGVYIYRKDLKF